MAELPFPFVIPSPLVARCVVASAVVIGALVAAATPVVEPVPPPAPEALDVVVVEHGLPARATWSAVQPSGGCWFFSGPEGLGRDHALGADARIDRDGQALTLWFGDASFKGDVDAAGNVVLTHQGSGDDNGSGWLYRETFTGTFHDDTLNAGYGYRECELDGRGGCPVVSRGHCTISGRVNVKVIEEPAPSRHEPEPQPAVEYDTPS
jgi:hypothetical protein